MTQDHTKKEALFNEVKGSLFEYLVGKEISKISDSELQFQKSIDQNYLTVLAQQDRMVRQFYPDMLPFLAGVSHSTAEAISHHFKEIPKSPKLTGKLHDSASGKVFHEADLLLEVGEVIVPLSLKLSKKNAFVNTKSGGVKSFISTYFPFVDPSYQSDFNQTVDLEFSRMSQELHTFHDLDYPGDFSVWTASGLSELPGELGTEERNILKGYYARIADKLHSILKASQEKNPEAFSQGLLPLMGFGSKDIIQVICYHDAHQMEGSVIDIHECCDLDSSLKKAVILPNRQTASVDLQIGETFLQIRIKPMNKFTTTAIKVNCSVKFKRPSDV